MKKISIHVLIEDQNSGSQEIKLEKSGPDEEIEVLASAMSTIFLKSKEALKIAAKKGGRVIVLGKKK